MESRRRCDSCKYDVHRASFAKHLRSKKHLENEKQEEMIIPEWSFQKPVGNTIKKCIILLKQSARENIILNDIN